MDDLVERLRERPGQFECATYKALQAGTATEHQQQSAASGIALAHANASRAADRIEKLEVAGQAILDRMSGTLSNGNGVEAADGEKCWIVHSDEIEALRATLSDNRGVRR